MHSISFLPHAEFAYEPKSSILHSSDQNITPLMLVVLPTLHLANYKKDFLCLSFNNGFLFVSLKGNIFDNQ